jgi:hypothetical protein
MAVELRAGYLHGKSAASDIMRRLARFNRCIDVTVWNNMAMASLGAFAKTATRRAAN